MLNIPEIRFFTLKSLRMRHLWMFVLDICVLFNWPIKIRMAGGGLRGIINIVSIGLPDNTFTIQTQNIHNEPSRSLTLPGEDP